MIRREKEGCWVKKKETLGRKPNMNDILPNDVDNMLLIRYNMHRVYAGGVQGGRNDSQRSCQPLEYYRAQGGGLL